MKLLVQEYLENHSLGDLVKDHGVYASFSKSGHKFSLNYDQIEAKESDPLSQECRGLILSLTDGQHIVGATNANGKTTRDHVIIGPTRVLAYPMKRFFNHGQGSAAEVNWNDPKLSILEKLDGTLCIVYWDNWMGNWCVATRSVPEADLLMDNGLFTFRTLFEKALKETCNLSFKDYTDCLRKDFTYCFELTTPYNRIVVNYPNNSITLLAVRNHHQELYLSDVDSCGVPKVKQFSYSSVEQLLDWVSTLNPMEYEGVVVLDSNFNRIKVKNAAYVAYNKIRDSLATSFRNMVELVLAEKDDDVEAFLPEEIVNNLKRIKTGIHHVMMKYDSVYYLMMLNLKALGEEKNKKEFALLVHKHKDMWSAPFFQMFDGKCSNMKDFIQKNKKDGSWNNSFLDKILEAVLFSTKSLKNSNP